MLKVLERFSRSATTLLVCTALGGISGEVLGAEETGELETIVVTAQKREENLQTVPVAVTAITAQMLQDMHFEALGDLGSMAPGLSVRESAGGNEQPVFTMRGVYSGTSFGADPSVALYIDGVYIPSPIGADFDLADVERIEVLRGPQGTLFGRSAIGGAVNIITREPSGTFQVHQQLSGGNLGQFRSRSSIDSPTFGIFSAQLTYLHDQRNGDVRNLGAGTVWNYGPATDGYIGTQVSPSTLGGHDTDAAHLALKLETESGIKLIYRGDYTHKDTVPDAAGIGTFNTGNSISGLIQSFWAGQSPTVRTPISLSRPDAVNNWYTTTGLLTSQNNNLALTLPVSDHVTIKNTVAYDRLRDYTDNQLDALGGLYSPGAPPNTPLLVLDNSNELISKTYSEELQADIDTSFIKSTIGYLNYYSGLIQGGFPNMENTPFGSGLVVGPGVYLSPPYSNFVAPANPAALHNVLKTRSNALYTQSDIPLLPKLDLLVGGRYSWDHRTGADNSPTPAAPGTVVRSEDSKPSYLLGLNYSISSDIFAYAKWSTGYISGGQLANVKFSPSTANSYEVGIKSDLLDRRLRLNIAAYTAKYNALQIFTNPLTGCGNVPGVALTAAECVVNGGDARASGVEVETTFIPVKGVTLAGNVGYTNIYFTTVAPYLRAPDGTFVPTYTPAWTASLSAQYLGPEIGALGGAHFIGRIEGNFTSSAYGFPNSPLVVENLGKIPATWILNGRLGIGGLQVGRAEVEIAAFVKNLTNNGSIAYDFNGAADIPVTYQTGRMFGIDVNIGFGG
jgi:iron complex outermembrane receptor protein